MPGPLGLTVQIVIRLQPGALHASIYHIRNPVWKKEALGSIMVAQPAVPVIPIAYEVTLVWHAIGTIKVVKAEGANRSTFSIKDKISAIIAEIF
jgi:hypothetical protein